MRNKNFWKLTIVVLTFFGNYAWAKTEKYIFELSEDKSFSEPHYDNNYDGCGEDEGEDGTNMCLTETPTGRTQTYKTKEECTSLLDDVLLETTGKYLDKNKDSIVFLADDGRKVHARCVAYDFDKLLD